MRKGRTDHVVHLVCDVLQPCLLALHSGNHLSELRADDGLRAERFAEGFPLVDPPTEGQGQSVSLQGETRTYFKHSSTIFRCALTVAVTMTHRSWLKLLDQPH